MIIDVQERKREPAGHQTDPLLLVVVHRRGLLNKLTTLGLGKISSGRRTEEHESRSNIKPVFLDEGLFRLRFNWFTLGSEHRRGAENRTETWE